MALVIDKDCTLRKIQLSGLKSPEVGMKSRIENVEETDKLRVGRKTSNRSRRSRGSNSSSRADSRDSSDFNYGIFKLGVNLLLFTRLLFSN